MAEFSEEKLDQAIADIKATFADGFQWADIPKCVKSGMEFAELFKLSGPEKKELALRYLDRILKETDIPWFPDWLADPIIKAVAPALMDIIVDATKGLLGVNKSE